VDYAEFDTKGYRTLPVVDGYREWAAHYEDSVHDAMDLRLLERIRSVDWKTPAAVVDLACGTGRIGAWLARQGARVIDGVDLTSEMLEQARGKGVYRSLSVAPVERTGLAGHAYDLAIQVLADEHLRDLGPLYAEAARLTNAGGPFVIVGYHPFFLLSGQPTHFHRRADHEPLTIESYIHLASDHVHAAHAAGWRLAEMHEGLVDDEWLAAKPKWAKYRNRPVSYAMVWVKSS
jgi:SAM-dependent methyltransferase